MLAFQWNALRTGDRVLVHDDDDPAFVLDEGVVALVQTHVKADNDIAVRLATAPSRTVRPRRHAVHMAPLDRRFQCWRCDAADVRASAATPGRIAA